MIRSIGAVLAGYAAMAVVVVLATKLAVKLMSLQAPPGGMPAPTGGYLVVNLLYSFAAALLGGWITARLAASSPLGHAAALAGFALLMAVVSSLAGPQAQGQPAWYPWVIGLLGAAGVLAGGWLRAAGQLPAQA
jgi:hypothetical protein